VVVLNTTHATREGKSLDSKGADVWHVRGGKAVEFWHLDGDQAAAAEFWA